MQICTLPQTDNHASIPPLSFLQAVCPLCRPINSVKALKAVLIRNLNCQNWVHSIQHFSTTVQYKIDYMVEPSSYWVQHRSIQCSVICAVGLHCLETVCWVPEKASGLSEYHCIPASLNVSLPAVAEGSCECVCIVVCCVNPWTSSLYAAWLLMYGLLCNAFLGSKDSWLPNSSWWPANRHHSETCPWCLDMVSEVTSCLVSNYVKRANQVSVLFSINLYTPEIVVRPSGTLFQTLNFVI